MLYDLAVSLIGELPPQFEFIYGIFCLLLVFAIVGICLFPFAFIYKLFK
ncbi:MAG: hypothetical protein ACI4OT_00275 [Bacilli bacterium]